MSLLIRKMKINDIPAVLKMEKEVFSMPWSSWIFIQELLAPERFYIVAEVEGNLIGYAGMQWVLDEAHITTLAVKKEWRRKGIGSKLLEELIKKAKEKDLKFLTLEVRASNYPAINLYKKFGFVIEGTRRRYYVNPTEDGLIMTLRLKE